IGRPILFQPHQVAAPRRPRTEARPRRADNAKGLTNRGPLQKGGQRRARAVPTIFLDGKMVGTLRFVHPTVSVITPRPSASLGGAKATKIPWGVDSDQV